MSSHLKLLGKDFIEIDLPITHLTLRYLIHTALTELQVIDFADEHLKEVYVRKLPNTRLRRDIEVARLQDYQELEIGLYGKRSIQH